MTEEEMRQKILEKDDEIKKLNDLLRDSELKMTNYDTEKKMFEDRITELREYNKSLFLRITTPIQTEEKKEIKEEPKTKSIEDIIKDLEA